MCIGKPKINAQKRKKKTKTEKTTGTGTKDFCKTLGQVTYNFKSS